MRAKNLIAVTLLVLALLTGSTLDPLVSAATPESPYAITEFAVATGSTAQTYPYISGNIVVWAEQPGGRLFGATQSDIYALDLNTWQQTVICSANLLQLYPRIAGKLVVWEDRRSDFHGDIYAYDLEQNREFPVATGPAHQVAPAVSGNIIVWQENRNGSWDIYGYDVSTGKEFPVSTGPGDQSDPRISGTLVVWREERVEADGSLNCDVYGYDLASQQGFSFATGPAYQSAPDVSGPYIVWSESFPGAIDRSIHVFDMSVRAETIIARGAWDLNSPVVHGGLVVWSDNREGKGFDIYGYDLHKKAEFPVSRAIGDQTQPAIYEMRVVWEDNRNQGVGKYDWNADIYGAKLEDKPGPIVSVIGALSEVDAKIEIVWPKGGASVTEADRANISVYLFRPGTLDIAPCQWWPTVRLWAALNNGQAQPVAVAIPGVRYGPIGSLRTWEFNDVDVSATRNPWNRIYFFVTIDGVDTHTNVWAHGADVRTYFPQQEIPSGIGVAGDKLDVKIQIVWPHDVQGNPRSVAEASLVNIGVNLFVHGTQLSVPPDWSGTVRLYRSLNNGVEEFVLFAQERLVASDGVVYPRWDFNNVDVSAATDPTSKYYFRVAVDDVETTSNVWSHGADGRTYFPYIDVPTSGCAQE